MDIAIFVIVVLALIAAFFFLRRSEKRTKNKYKIAGYRLLDAPDPTVKELLHTIKMLKLYGGSWRKDKEFIELVSRLQERLQQVEAKQPQI